MIKHKTYQDRVLELRALQETPDDIADGSNRQRMTSVDLYSCLYDLPKEGANLANSRPNNDLDMEDARELSTLFADSHSATVVAVRMA